jgi:hypothetical protein
MQFQSTWVKPDDTNTEIDRISVSILLFISELLCRDRIVILSPFLL